MKITHLNIASQFVDGRDSLVCTATVDGVQQCCAGLGLTTDGGKWSTPDEVAKTLEQFATAIRRMEQKSEAA